ncbi:hypothetical protein X777_13023 [Ooceraea biroi]|uniref:Uncharacterized protein n=1 Tax=Ooceraea biroi TaxID=2015173 RepID=A0A026WXR0_OOCBI|nr:hypothetical protein X777_13023 [Ooceraea biroi]
MAPKITNSSSTRIVETATYIAVCLLNEGATSLLKIMNAMSIKPGKMQRNSQLQVILVDSAKRTFARNTRLERLRFIVDLSKVNWKKIIQLRRTHFMV